MMPTPPRVAEEEEDGADEEVAEEEEDGADEEVAEEEEDGVDEEVAEEGKDGADEEVAEEEGLPPPRGTAFYLGLFFSGGCLGSRRKGCPALTAGRRMALRRIY